MTKFHVRGGAKWRKVYTKIKRAKTARYVCPTCSKQSVVRQSIGVWLCKSCGAEFAGGAYEFSTPAGRLAQRLLSDLSKKGKPSEAELKEIEEIIEKGELQIEGQEEKDK